MLLQVDFFTALTRGIQQGGQGGLSSLLQFGQLKLQEEQLKEKQRELREQTAQTRTLVEQELRQAEQARMMQQQLLPAQQDLQDAFVRFAGDARQPLETARAAVEPIATEARKQRRAAQEQAAKRAEFEEGLDAAVQVLPEGSREAFKNIVSMGFKDSTESRLLEFAIPTPKEQIDEAKRRLELIRLQQTIQESETKAQADAIISQRIGLGFILPGISDEFDNLVIDDLKRQDVIADKFSNFVGDFLQSPASAIIMSQGGANINDPASIAEFAQRTFVQAFSGVFGTPEEISAAIGNATGFVNPAYVPAIEIFLRQGLTPDQIVERAEPDVRADVIRAGGSALSDKEFEKRVREQLQLIKRRAQIRARKVRAIGQ